MKDLNWIMMLDILSGAKFTNYGLNQMAQLNCGEVIETKQYMLMTERNYEPTSAERFAAVPPLVNTPNAGSGIPVKDTSHFIASISQKIPPAPSIQYDP